MKTLKKNPLLKLGQSGYTVFSMGLKENVLERERERVKVQETDIEGGHYNVESRGHILRKTG